MDQVVWHVRRVGLAAVALLSMAVGVGTIWVVARPDVIGRVPTWTLFGVVGLLVLPLAVVGALLMDRKAIAAAAPGSHLPRTEDQVIPFLTGAPTPTADRPGPGKGIAHVGSSGQPTDAQRHRHHRVAVPAHE